MDYNNQNQPAPVFDVTLNETIPMHMAFTTEPPPLDFVIPGLLAGTVGGIVAAGATGKSYLSLGIGADLVTGANKLGMGIEAHEGRVMYLTLEDPQIVLRHRIHALGALFDDHQRAELDMRLEVASKVGQHLQLVDPNGNRNEALVTAMVERFKGYRLIILDTLRRFHAGEENSTGHMATVIGCFETIAHYTGAAVLFLHHTNKTSNLMGSNEAGASRGSSAITDNIRCQLNLNTMTEEESGIMGVMSEYRHKYVKLTNSKVNYLENKGENWLRRAEGGVLVAHSFNDTPLSERPQKPLSDTCGGKR